MLLGVDPVVELVAEPQDKPVVGAVTVVAVGVEKEWVAEEVTEEAEVVAGVAEVVVAALSVVTGWRARTTQGQKG